MSIRRCLPKKAFCSSSGVVHGYFLVTRSAYWCLMLRRTYANGIAGFKDRVMRYELISSVLLLLLSYSLDDCDSAIE